MLRLNKLPALPRKIVVGVAGGIILVAGVIMLVTPGPAVVLIPVGLLLLASEFKFMEDAAKAVLDRLTRARKAYRQWWSDRS